MTRILVYLFLIGTVLYFFSLWTSRQTVPPDAKTGSGGARPNRWFRPKKNPREVWIQVYETATVEEARTFQARLQEQEIECIIYEQGKKDIHGNPLKGIGIAVPKSAAPHAQNLISRMPM